MQLLVHVRRLLAALFCAAVGLVVALMLIAVYPPADLLRRAASPLGVRGLAHWGIAGFDLETLEFSLGRKGFFEIRGLRVGESSRPLLAASRVAVRYHADLKAGVPSITIDSLEIERPAVELFTPAEGAESDWTRLVASLADTRAPLESSEQSAAQEPSAFKLRVERFQVSDATVRLGGPEVRVELEGLSLEGNLSASAEGMTLAATLEVGGARPNLKATGSMIGPEELLLHHQLKATAAFDLHDKRSGSLNLAGSLTAIGDPWQAIMPDGLAYRLNGGLENQRLTLEHFRLESAKQLSLLVHGELSDIESPGAFSLRVSRFELDCGRLERLARIWLPALRLSGSMRSQGIEVRGDLTQIATQPPNFSGALSFDAFGIGLRRGGKVALLPAELLPARLRGLSGRTEFGYQGHGAPLQLSGDLSVREVLSAAGQVSNLTLSFGGSLDVAGYRPGRGQLELKVGARRVSGIVSGLGNVESGVGAAASLEFDLPEEHLALTRAHLSLDKTLKLNLTGSVKGFSSSGQFRLDGRVPDLSLSLLLSRLPPALREKIPFRATSGRFVARLRAKGPLVSTWHPERPLALPIEADAQLTLSDLTGAVKLAPKRFVRFDGIALTLELQKRRAVTLDAALSGRQLALPELGVQVNDPTLAANLTVRSSEIRGKANVSLSRGTVGSALELGQTSVKLQGTSAVALARVLAGAAEARKAALELELETRQVTVAHASEQFSASEFALSVGLDHDARRDLPLQWNSRTRVGSMVAPLRGLEGDALTFEASGKATGYRLAFPQSELELAGIGGELGARASLGGLRAAAVTRPLGPVSFDLQTSLEPGGALAVQSMALVAAGIDFEARLDGSVERPLELASGSIKGLRARAHLALGSKGAEMRQLVRDFSQSGRLELDLDVGGGGKLFDVEAAVRADGFGFNYRTALAVGSQASARRIATASLDTLDAKLHLQERIRLELSPFSIALREASTAATSEDTRRDAYTLIRPFVRRRESVAVAGFEVSDTLYDEGERVLSRSKLSIPRTTLDLGVNGRRFEINRVYLDLFGGDVVGDFSFKLLRRRPLDFSLLGNLRMTDVDVGQLDPQGKKELPLSGLARIEYRHGRRDLSSRLILTDISLDSLDSLLAYLDPHGQDPAVQANRKLLGAGYIRLARPEVERVVVWIDHSQLNLDIDLDAIWPFSTILRRMMRRSRVRRLSISPLLEGAAGAVDRLEEDASATMDAQSEATPGSVRRRAGAW